MIEFNIVEDTSDDKYQEYIRLYNKGLKVREIGEKLDVSSGRLTTFYKHAIEEGLIQPRNNKGNNKPRFKPKYYNRNSNGFYTVYSPKRNNSKRSNFGTYPSEDEAKYVVEELKKVNWNRRCLRNIQLRAMELYPIDD